MATCYLHNNFITRSQIGCNLNLFGKVVFMRATSSVQNWEIRLNITDIICINTLILQVLCHNSSLCILLDLDSILVTLNIVQFIESLSPDLT